MASKRSRPTERARRVCIGKVLELCQSAAMKTVGILSISLAMGCLAACQSPKVPSPVAQSVPAPPIPERSAVAAPQTQTLPPDSAPAIARREVIRRQEQIRRMDDAALRASQAMAEDDLEGAVKGYRQAVGGLP